MLKNMSRIEMNVNGKTYHFTCDIDSPLKDCKEAVFQIQKYLGMIEDNIKAQQELAKKDAEEPKEATEQAVA